MFDIVQKKRGNRIQINRTRDTLLDERARALMTERFLLPEESYQDLFARIALHFADDDDHAQRLYDYMSKLWFLPAVPILAHGGTNEGLSIAHFNIEAPDTLGGIIDLWREQAWLSALGGGTGCSWGNVRSAGEEAGAHTHGRAAGILPFIRVMDSVTNAMTTGVKSSAKSSGTIYLPIWHPEIEGFLHESADTNLQTGVFIPNSFMQALENNEEWALKSPKDGHIVHRLPAQHLWALILEKRRKTGAPFLIFGDAVNSCLPSFQRLAGMTVRAGGLTPDLMLPAGIDHNSNERTACCPRGALNVARFEEWQDNDAFIPDVMRFFDNVLSDFIRGAPDSLAKAKYTAMRARALGLSVIGFHSFLQARSVAFETPMAKVWNRRLFQHIKREVDDASLQIGAERGACPDAADFGFKDRFSAKLALGKSAPLAIICGVSEGIAPCAANITKIRSLSSGKLAIKNPLLQKLLAEKNLDTNEIWDSIAAHNGSVAHLEALTEPEKQIFRTKAETDALWLIEHAADRSSFICQGQDFEITIPANTDPENFAALHKLAWQKGLKTISTCLLTADPQASLFDPESGIIEEQTNTARRLSGDHTPELGDRDIQHG